MALRTTRMAHQGHAWHGCRSAQSSDCLDLSAAAALGPRRKDCSTLAATTTASIAGGTHRLLPAPKHLESSVDYDRQGNRSLQTCSVERWQILGRITKGTFHFGLVP